MKINIVDDKSPYLNDVIDLGDANSRTLGFLPKRVFVEKAQNKRILGAFDDTKKLVGYLLYEVNSQGSFVYITHLCVSSVQRGKGIAKALFEALKQKTHHHFRGVRVHCRQDYEADKMWPQLGFIYVDERPGRSALGSKLTVWWFDYGHPHIFNFAYKLRSKTKLTLAIDANVFFQLIEKPDDSNKDAKALLADWLQDEVELCLTKEIHNEIYRNRDEIARKKMLASTSRFMMLPSEDDDTFQQICKALRPFFGKNLKESDSSDLRQLARSIAAGVNFFITKDEDLIKKSKAINEKFDLQIITPCDLIIHQDALRREAEYQPARLSGSSIKIELIGPEMLGFLEEYFRPPNGETKAEFRKIISPCLSDPHRFQTHIIKEQEKPLALRVYGRTDRDILEIPVLRVLPGPLADVLARHILFQSKWDASRENRPLTHITDRQFEKIENIDVHPFQHTVKAIEENGFFPSEDNGGWIKLNLSVIKTKDELSVFLLKNYQRNNLIFQKIKQIAESLRRLDKENILPLLDIEQAFFPAKIKDIDIPAFIVPIKAQWAMNLFDTEIANQGLFGGKPELMFNTENVYYRSSYQKVLTAPARILWYVSKHGIYQGTGAIRAASYLHEVVIDKPSVLYQKFKGLGVYGWKDVLEVSENNPEKQIMAFRFCNTELFKSPIQSDELKGIWDCEDGKRFSIQSPLKISTERFFQLYKMGNGAEKDRHDG